MIWIVKWASVERKFSTKREALDYARRIHAKHRETVTVLAVST